MNEISHYSMYIPTLDAWIGHVGNALVDNEGMLTFCTGAENAFQFTERDIINPDCLYHINYELRAMVVSVDIVIDPASFKDIYIPNWLSAFHLRLNES